MPKTEDYLQAIREARDGGKRVRLDFGLMPEGVNREAVFDEISDRLPGDYKVQVNNRFVNHGGVELDFGKVKLEPTIIDRAEKLFSTAVATADRIANKVIDAARPAAIGLAQTPGRALGAVEKAVATVVPPAIAFREEELDLIKRPLLERIRNIAPVEDFPRLGEDKAPEFGKLRLSTRAVLEAAVEDMTPLTLEDVALAVGIGKGISIGATALVKRFPWLAKEIHIPKSVSDKILTELNTAVFRAKRGLGISQETGLVPVDVRQAVANGKLPVAQAARINEDFYREELLKRILPEELRKGVEPEIKPTEAVPSVPSSVPEGPIVPPEAAPKPQMLAPVEPSVPILRPEPTTSVEIPTPKPPIEIPSPTPPTEALVKPPDFEVGQIVVAKDARNIVKRIEAFGGPSDLVKVEDGWIDAQGNFQVSNAPGAVRELSLAALRENFEKFDPKAEPVKQVEATKEDIEKEIDHGLPKAIIRVESAKGKAAGKVKVGEINFKDARALLDTVKSINFDVNDPTAGDAQYNALLNPAQTIKAKAAGLLTSEGKSTPQALAAMRELDRLDRMMADGFIDAVDILPAKKMNLENILKDNLDSGRQGLARMAEEKGWMTDGRVMLQVPKSAKAIVKEYAGRAPKDAAMPDLEPLLSGVKAAKTPVEKIIGAKEDRSGNILFMLETAEGWRVVVNSTYWRLVNDTYPGAKWLAAGPDKALRAAIGGETVGVVMPMRFDEPLLSVTTGKAIPAVGAQPVSMTAKTGGASAGGKASKGGFAEDTPVELGGIEHIKPFQMPEMVKLAKELMGEFPEISKRMGKQTMGLFKPLGDGIIRLRPELFASPEQAAKTLAHEIGHLIDYLPDHYLKRGNLLGRLLTLRSHLKSTFGELTVTNPELREELLAVSQFWRPYDPKTSSASFLAYRKGSDELYADAISVLLNSPGTLERMAPKFYKGFFDNLDKKLEVKKSFLGLQEFVNGKDVTILKAREEDIRQMFARGDEIFKLKNAEKELRHGRLWERLRQELDDINYPITKKIGELEARGEIVPDEMNPKFRLQEVSLADNVNHLMLSRLDREVMDPVEKLGMSVHDIGEYLFLNRVLRDRANLANPLGHNTQTAQMQLDFLRKNLGEEKYTALSQSVDRLHDIIFESVEEAVRVGTYNKELFETTIRPNKGNYASFAVLDYLENTGYIAPTVKQQVGTLKEIADPFVATLMKTVALNRLNIYQRAKVAFRDLWQLHFADEIKPSKALRAGPGPAIYINSPGLGRIEMFEDGKLASYDVDPYIAQAFEKTKYGDLNIITDILSSLNRGLFHPLYITYNPGFALAFNPIRDFKRTYKAIPGASLRTLMVEYIKALPAAKRRTAGFPDPVVEEMVKNFALDVPFNDFNFDPREDQYGVILTRYGLSSDPKSKLGALRKTLAKPLIQTLEALRFVGSMLEVLPKIAGYNLRKKFGESGDILAYNTLHYTGTPNFRVKGLRTQTTNAFFMFSNIIKEGIKSDLQLAVDPKTRGGYWWKTVKVDIMPKFFMVLASSGVLGKELKDHYDRMSEYDKTNYITFPVGRVDGKEGKWKSLYVRFPHDETGRLAGAVFWKMAQAFKGKPQAWQQILAFGAGQLPTVSPAIDLASTWGTYLAGKNPYDWFRGRPILPETEFKAGGWPSLKRMVEWTVNEFGFTQFTTHDPSEKTTFEMTLQLTPVFNRLIKASDYGLREQTREVFGEVERERAVHRLNRGDGAKKFLMDRWRLQQAKQAEAIPSQDLRKLKKMERFYAMTFGPIDSALRRAEERGDISTTVRLRKQLDERVDQFEQKYEE